MTTENKNSFIKGWEQIHERDRYRFREDLMSALGITSLQMYHCRKRGDTEPKKSVAEKIEIVFKKYGVKKRDVWGESNTL